MFRRVTFSVCLALILPGCGPEYSFFLLNKLPVARPDEPVAMTRPEFEQRFGKGGREEAPVLKSAGNLIPSQLDDLDGDGDWDEIAFAVNIAASSNLKIDVAWLPVRQVPVFEKRTQVYLAEQQPDGSFAEVSRADAPQGLDGFPARYQSEGIGWENDKIAFRIYFDCRNTKDLFGKLIPDLILQKAGTPGSESYHNLSGWGMDILHCGSSLGAGGLALMEGDSLYRLGSTPVYRYVEISEGPVRAILELDYQGWEVAGQQYEATERITLWAGKHWFRSEVTVREFSGVKRLATGIVTTKLDNEPIRFEANDAFSVLLTHGIQSLNNDVLAMAVMAPSGKDIKTGRTSNLDFYRLGYQTVPVKNFSQVISETCHLSQNIESGTPSRHFFFAMWGLENPRWNDVENVKDYIRLEADKISHQLIIKSIRK